MSIFGAIPALFYLAISAYAGRRLCAWLLPAMDGSQLSAERRYVAPWVISVPMAFLTGTLLVTWATYLTASALRHTSSPMGFANIVVLTTISIVLGIVAFRRRMRDRQVLAADTIDAASPRQGRLWIDIAVTATGIILGAIIMFHTCRIEGDTLILGRTAFGDLNIHLGMARSFSFGNNFPTGYMAYAGNDIRYHFMFYFLVGNLEFLGLQLDWAINHPSILGFTSVMMLLHAIGSSVGRHARVGVFTVLFFLLRSSPAAFAYFKSLPGSFTEKVAALFHTTKFIGLTTHETWGIWNLNVYAVERHFGFAFGLVLIGLLYLVRITGLDSGVPLLQLQSPKESTRESSPS